MLTREMYGVSVECERAWPRWEAVLDEWLPRLDRLGWLDELETIHIHGERLGDGRYNPMEREVKINADGVTDPAGLVSGRDEAVIIHEIAHHAHERELGVLEHEEPFPCYFAIVDSPEYSLYEDKREQFEPLVKEEVSDYAKMNALEVVAEVAVGALLLDEDYSDEIAKLYVKLGGPKLCP